MVAKRRGSSRTGQKAADVSFWVEHNQQQPRSPRDERHVQIVAPPSPTPLSTTESTELKEEPVYEDGGFGWFVVFASFIMHAICDGESFCFGIVYVLIQKIYGAGRVSSMFVASCFLSMPLAMAPIAGMVSDRYGCRFSIILGGTISLFSCILAVFCPNMWLFSPVFGFGCGLGMAFIYNAAIAIVTYYFDKKRGVATSLAVSGTGFGTFVFPAYLTIATRLLEGFVDELQAVLFAFALAFAIVVALGLAIRDVEWESDTTDYKLKKFELSVKTLLEDQESTTKNPKESLLRRANSLPNLNLIRVEDGSIQSVVDVGKADGKTERPVRSKSMALFENQNQLPVIHEYSMINPRLANLEHLDLELANSPCTTVRAQRRRVISKVSMSVDQINELDNEDFKVSRLFPSSTNSTAEETESSSDDSEMSNDGDSSSSELSEKQLEEPTTKLINKNLTVVATRAASSVPTSARIIRNSLAPGSTNVSGGRILASNAIQPRYVSNLLTMGKIPSAPMLVARKKRKALYRTQKSISKRLAEERASYSLVLQRHSFRYLLLSVFCLYFILDVPYVCFFEYAVEHLNMSETLAKSVYSAIGGCNFVSTTIYGQLADHQRTRRYMHWIYFFSMCMITTTLIAATFVTTSSQIIFIGGLFGVFVTCNYVLQSILVTICFEDIIVFQCAYSLVSLLEGIASFIGPPIFAVIREETGSYAVVFIIGGVLTFLSGVFMFVFFRKLCDEVAAEETEELECGDPSTEAVTNGTVRQNEQGTGAEVENLLRV